ncbi:unnamed protein product [Eruca vesicaria subsp. sativa]|uniref:Two-component response regulator n=1 Tax=Eruca vesicaria subsp. sativa TaxID=29727 RepID=A0ABC8J884_ERUVS|nr:unnamed protein product [Eruca vesicaria subsp. sativa]
MAFAQSFYNQSPVLRINVMVVDDDPVFLQIMSRKLENLKLRVDPSTVEIMVIAVKDSREAMSTLQIQRNNIDLIVTDYYMPDMNGLQLKEQINQEYGNLPVILMSSDTDKEHESLTCGAMGFIPKPIKATALTKIYQLALTCKRNGKSTLWIENNHNDTDVSIAQRIQLVPDQDNLMMMTKKKFSRRPDSKSVKSSNGSCVISDASRKNNKRTPNGGSGDDVDSLSQPSKKNKITWTDDLHILFLQAIQHLGLDKAVPKKILEFMNLSYLTRENVASHLQKYRQFLRKVSENGTICSSMMPSFGIDSIYPYAHIREPYYNNYTSSSWYGTTLNNTSYSKPGHGLGQSRLLSNTSDPIRFNEMRHNYMNRSSNYEPHHVESNLNLPIESNLSYSSQNEGRRSFLESTYGNLTSNQLGSNSHGILTPNQPGVKSYGSATHNAQLNNFGSITPHQPGSSNFSYGLESKNNANTPYNPQPQPHANATAQPNSEIPQLESLSLYDELGNISELPWDISNFQVDHNKVCQQEAVSTTQFEFPAMFSTEMNQLFTLEEDNDWTFVNVNQRYSNGETSNNFAPETNSQTFNMSANHDQDLASEFDFMESLFNGMK